MASNLDSDLLTFPFVAFWTGLTAYAIHNLLLAPGMIGAFIPMWLETWAWRNSFGRRKGHTVFEYYDMTQKEWDNARFDASSGDYEALKEYGISVKQVQFGFLKITDPNGFEEVINSGSAEEMDQALRNWFSRRMTDFSSIEEAQNLKQYHRLLFWLKPYRECSVCLAGQLGLVAWAIAYLPHSWPGVYDQPVYPLLGILVPVLSMLAASLAEKLTAWKPKHQ